MSAIAVQSDLSVSRFESRIATLDRWGRGSNPRFLRRRPRDGWRRRTLDSQLRQVAPSQEKGDSMLRQGLEVGLFGTYLLVFLACLWMLG